MILLIINHCDDRYIDPKIKRRGTEICNCKRKLNLNKCNFNETLRTYFQYFYFMYTKKKREVMGIGTTSSIKYEAFYK